MDRTEIVACRSNAEDIFSGMSSNSRKEKMCLAFRGSLQDRARENVHMESFNGDFKQDNRDLFWDQDSIKPLKNVAEERIRYYYFDRKHSALGNKPPMKYLKERAK